MWLELPLGGGGYLLPPLGAGLAPSAPGSGGQSWLPALASALDPLSSGLRYVAGLHPVGPAPRRSQAGSAGIKEAVSRKEGEQIFLCVLLSLPFSSACGTMVQVGSQAGGTGERRRGSSLLPPPAYLEGFAYPHHRM